MPLSEQQFTDRFGTDELVALTDPESRTEIKAAVFAAAVQDAFAEITATLNGLTTLNSNALPNVVIGILADLTRYRLYADTAPESVLTRAVEARTLLAKLASGAALLEYDSPIDVRISTENTGFAHGLWNHDAERF